VRPSPAATSAAARAPAAGHRPHCGDAAPPRTVARGWRWCFHLGIHAIIVGLYYVIMSYISRGIYIYIHIHYLCSYCFNLFIYLCIYLFIYLSIYLFIYLRSIYVILGYNEDVFFFYMYV
jgi:hypothetical protein